ncbi:MAG: hypothetical protein PHG65_06790 [Kiritimatiellae bacterium]|nr:hypothetical protein [Kiritimatiellia bacterium]
MNKRVLQLGAFALFFLVLAGLIFLAVVFPRVAFPSEDAAILYTYSENLMEHGSIAYHPSCPPAEGATDFLWMLLIALVHRAGVPAFYSANLLSAAALLGTAVLLLHLAQGVRGGEEGAQVSDPGAGRSRLTAPAACCAWALFLMLLPPYFAAVLGFSVLFFGFFIILCVYFFVSRRSWALAAVSLATCLIRPDGVVFAGPLFLVFILSERVQWKSRLVAGLLGAAVPGLLYFVWRWHYFGLLFPLPFYVKSHFDRYLFLFNRDSLLTNLRFVVAVLPFLVLALRRRAGETPGGVGMRRRLLLALWPVPFLFYSCMNLEQNIAFRFQYPLVLAGVAPALPGLNASAKNVRRLVLSALWCVLVLSPWYLVEGYRTLCTPTENMPRLAMNMANLPGGGRIATTEAGRLPYYSGWETMDLWGLNTPELARRVVMPEDIDRFRPDLIVLHTSGDYYGDDWRFLSAADTGAHPDRTWSNMVGNTYLAARRAGYALYMVPHRLPEQADPFSAWLASLRPRINRALGHQGAYDTYYAFLVRPDSPSAPELTALIGGHGGISYERYQQNKQHFIEQSRGAPR